MTLSDRDWDLLQHEIDGETSPEESTALRERLQNEPELAAQYQALSGVERALAEVGLVDPPPELAGDVMHRVHERAASRTGRWIAWLPAPLAARPGLALAASLAVGLLAGALLTSLAGWNPLEQVEPDALLGTALPPDALAALPVVDEARLEAAGIRASVVARWGDGEILAELELAGPGAADVTVEVDGRTLRPRGFRSDVDVEKGGVILEADRTVLRQVREGRYVVSLAVLGPDPGPLRVGLEAGGTRAEATLFTNFSRSLL